ncbi:serine/threonine-protein kinase [Antrihabitans stalactiti]|uniref:non-specific serine/threonine protein kinase n=1 Tax=Antrihabitans stalactiti TaxID=2584121 RepID=A0A848KCC6_9NOCA|nr:serine/threonine-protein kinase [Antrihabitans stalactiti]NMN96523.1 serine/threonine protein kinase [Antrihabitans stalactiti]
MALERGSVFAGYTIEGKLGAGGMGVVYLAKHPRLPRRIALKVLGESFGSEPEFRARFEREAELAARLDHPNVVSVYDRGTEGEQLWIAMQYVDGVDVAHLVKQGPASLPPDRAIYILGQAARGLDNAHKHGLLHRDVKPANILVAMGDEDGEKVLVTDFGIARALDETIALTQAGSMPATLAYASPEQIEGHAVDHRADIYSLGCTLYVMLTGSVPYSRTSYVGVMHAHLSEPPPLATRVNPALPRRIDDVIARAMAKNPNDRYSSSRELANAAAAALATSPNYAATALRQVPDLSSGPHSSSFTAPPSNPSNPSMPTVLSNPSHPSAPNFGSNLSAPQSNQPAGKSKRGLKIGIAVAAAAVVVGGVVTAVALSGGSDSGSSAGSSTSTTTSAPVNNGPWGQYSFVAAAFPKLVPTTPDGTGPQGKCVPYGANGDAIDVNTMPTGVARMRCGEKLISDASKITVLIECNKDQSISTLAGRDLTGARDETWTRTKNAGRLRVGETTDDPPLGAVIVSFDNRPQNACLVWALGLGTGQQVYDQWWATAPIDPAG